MKRSFSLVELIFVMVIIGILSATAIYGFRPKNLRNDTNYIFMQILKTKYQGMMYDKRGLLEGPQGCIDLKEERLKILAKKDHYIIKSHITAPNAQILCFDRFGRPHLDDNATYPGSLIHEPTLLLTLSYQNEERNITLLPQSGYVIIGSK